MTPAMDDLTWMRLALEEARRAPEHGDVPIGAVVVRDGAVLARAHNRREVLARMPRFVYGTHYPKAGACG